MFTEEIHIKKMIRCEHYGDIFYFDAGSLVTLSLENQRGDWSIHLSFGLDYERCLAYSSEEDALEAFENIEKQLC